MSGQGRTVATAWGCQQRCKNTPGCFFFNHWSDGGCHITTGAEGTEETGSSVTSGSQYCEADNGRGGRCGPKFQNRKCNCSGYEKYCNTANGWCGNTSAHKNAQKGDEFDCQDKFTIVNPHTSKVIDVSGGSCNSGTNIQLWHNYKNHAQIFRYDEATKAIYNVHCNKVLDISGGACNNGQNIHLWGHHGGGNQQWKFTSDGMIESVGCPGKVIDISGYGTGNGSNLHLWSIHRGWNQKWTRKYI